MKNPAMEKFSEFYENWAWKLEQILHHLLEASKKRTEAMATMTEQELQALLSKVTTLLKWGTAREDVLVFFAPIWLTPLENAYLWATGSKPSTAFKLLEYLTKKKVLKMTVEQERKIEELRVRMKMQEEKVEREMEMERQQVAMADRKIVELVKLSSRGIRVNNNGVDQVGGGVDGVVEVVRKPGKTN